LGLIPVSCKTFRLLLLRERGLNYRHVKEFESENIVKCSRSDFYHELHPVVLLDLFPVLGLLCLGMIMSVKILVLELHRDNAKKEFGLLVQYALSLVEKAGSGCKMYLSKATAKLNISLKYTGKLLRKFIFAMCSRW